MAKKPTGILDDLPASAQQGRPLEKRLSKLQKETVRLIVADYTRRLAEGTAPTLDEVVRRAVELGVPIGRSAMNELLTGRRTL